MINYEAMFDGYEIPERLKNLSVIIMKRFTITGICDGMYIANVIARENGLGDGGNNFNSCENASPLVWYPKETAERLQAAYGCNILKEDIPELEEILLKEKLDKQKAIRGFNERIETLKREMADEKTEAWRNTYLILQLCAAAQILQAIEEGETK